MNLWNGKPISSLDTSHIERILSASRRGAWADGKPCRVRPETLDVLRSELRSRGSGDFVTPQGKYDAVEPVAPPNYDDQLAAMGYAPPPIPPPQPWSPTVKTKLPLFPSASTESMDPKGERLIEKLREEIAALTEDIGDRDSVIRQLTRRLTRQQDANDRLRIEMKAQDRVNQPMAKRLEAMERRAAGDDLEDIDETALIAWWREEVEDCSGVLIRGLDRLLNLAARGIDVKTIRPRKLRRPGIQKD